MEKLRVGIVGCGHIVTSKHLPVFKKLREIEVVAICDKNRGVAENVARQFNVARHFDDSSEMFRQGLDMVDICTPIQTHYALAIEAMKSGSNVLVEKPLAMNARDVDEMYEVSKKKKVKLCVVHQNIFNEAVMEARHLVEEGRVGDIISVDVGTYVTRDYHLLMDKNHWAHKLPGGIFFETLPHPVYLLQLFLGNIEPSCVAAERFHFPWMKADEMKVLIKGERGLGSLAGSCNSPLHGDTLNIVGTQMSLQVDLWARSIVKYSRRTEDPYSIGKSSLRTALQSFGLIGTTIRNSFIMATGGIRVSAHYAFIRNFLKSVLNNDQSPPVSQQEAKENVRVIEVVCNALDRISQSGRYEPVHISGS